MEIEDLRAKLTTECALAIAVTKCLFAQPRQYFVTIQLFKPGTDQEDDVSTVFGELKYKTETTQETKSPEFKLQWRQFPIPDLRELAEFSVLLEAYAVMASADNLNEAKLLGQSEFELAPLLVRLETEEVIRQGVSFEGTIEREGELRDIPVGEGSVQVSLLRQMVSRFGETSPEIQPPLEFIHSQAVIVDLLSLEAVEKDKEEKEILHIKLSQKEWGESIQELSRDGITTCKIRQNLWDIDSQKSRNDTLSAEPLEISVLRPLSDSKESFETCEVFRLSVSKSSPLWQYNLVLQGVHYTLYISVRMEPIFAEIARSLRENHVTRVDVTLCDNEQLPAFSIHGFIVRNTVANSLVEKLNSSNQRVPTIFSKSLNFTKSGAGVTVKSLMRKDLGMDERLRWIPSLSTCRSFSLYYAKEWEFFQQSTLIFEVYTPPQEGRSPFSADFLGYLTFQLSNLDPEKQISISSKIVGVHPSLQTMYQNTSVEVQLRVALGTPPPELVSDQGQVSGEESGFKEEEREDSVPSTKIRPSPEHLRKEHIFSSPSDIGSKPASEILVSPSRVIHLNAARARSAPENQNAFVPPVPSNTVKLPLSASVEEKEVLAPSCPNTGISKASLSAESWRGLSEQPNEMLDKLTEQLEQKEKQLKICGLEIVHLRRENAQLRDVAVRLKNRLKVKIEEEKKAVTGAALELPREKLQAILFRYAKGHKVEKHKRKSLEAQVKYAKIKSEKLKGNFAKIQYAHLEQSAFIQKLQLENIEAAKAVKKLKEKEILINKQRKYCEQLELELRELRDQVLTKSELLRTSEYEQLVKKLREEKLILKKELDSKREVEKEESEQSNKYMEKISSLEKNLSVVTLEKQRIELRAQAAEEQLKEAAVTYGRKISKLEIELNGENFDDMSSLGIGDLVGDIDDSNFDLLSDI